MTKSSAPKNASPSLGAILSALIVVAVFVVLGFVLVNSRGGTAATPTTVASDATAVAAADATAAPAPGDNQIDPAVAARNDKYASSGAPAMSIDPKKTYIATITTPRGDIEVKLRPDIAPETVNNFVFLARDGYYDGVTWHRVLPNFMAQTGDPTGTGAGGPGYTIKDEFSPSISFDKPGFLAMAKTSAPNSAGSQFFITTAPATWLDGGYTIFGEVTKGQEIVDAIPLRNPDENPTTLGEKLIKITISES
ncbi:peptidylprolyl isomerase [Chloroflexia bacterium SDU3-3]|nr:peptidylprolyl isomerase [Chloroflexia bacterium SDU3-3]